MKVRLINAKELDDGLIAAWRTIHEADPALASPYFNPHFTRLAAEVRDDTFVGVMEDGGAPVGFFPFQRGKMGTGRPVGLALSDYQAVVVDARAEWSVDDLMRGCGLSCYDFDHLLAAQTGFDPYVAVREVSPIIDLSGGYDGWMARRMEMGGKQIKETQRRIRKLGREVGEHRFVRHAADPAAFAQLVAWKSEQCRTMGSVDYFSLGWPRELVERIHHTQLDDFAGVLCALYVGDRLIAVHFNMRSRTVWHSWFPGYDHELHVYSPGLILEMAMAEAAAAEGIGRIDMGKGMSTYKQNFMTDSIAITEGRVELPSLATAARKARRNIERWVRNSPLAPIARIPGRVIRKLERRKRFQ